MTEEKAVARLQPAPQVLGVDRYISDITRDLAQLVFEGPTAWELFMGAPWEALERMPDLNLPELIADSEGLQACLLDAPKGSAERLWFAGELFKSRITAAVAACVLAERALLDGHERLAWNYAMAAQDMRAVLKMLQVSAGPAGPKLAINVASANGGARHKRSRADKSSALVYFELNRDRFKTHQEAADALHKLFPDWEWTTVLGWLKGKGRIRKKK